MHADAPATPNKRNRHSLHPLVGDAHRRGVKYSDAHPRTPRPLRRKAPTDAEHRKCRRCPTKTKPLPCCGLGEDRIVQTCASHRIATRPAQSQVQGDSPRVCRTRLRTDRTPSRHRRLANHPPSAHHLPACACAVSRGRGSSGAQSADAFRRRDTTVHRGKTTQVQVECGRRPRTRKEETNEEATDEVAENWSYQEKKGERGRRKGKNYYGQLPTMKYALSWSWAGSEEYRKEIVVHLP